MGNPINEPVHEPRTAAETPRSHAPAPISPFYPVYFPVNDGTNLERL